MIQVAEEANSTFQDFMADAFVVPRVLPDVIAAGREIVAESGLYIQRNAMRH